MIPFLLFRLLSWDVCLVAALPPLLTYVLLYLLLLTVSLTDWLTGWLTVAPADSSYVSFPLIHIYTALGATKGRRWPWWSFNEVCVWEIYDIISACFCHEILYLKYVKHSRIFRLITQLLPSCSSHSIVTLSAHIVCPPLRPPAVAPSKSWGYKYLSACGRLISKGISN